MTTDEPKQGSLRKRVRAVWRREQLLRFTEGGLVFLRWALTMFFAGALLDWLTDMPAAGRGVILFVVLAVPLFKAWKAGWKHVRPFDPTHTALQIEERKGGMESLIVTALQLSDTNRRHGTSDALCDLTCSRAEASAGEIRAKEAVSFKALRDPAVVALIVILLFGVLVVTNGPLLLAGLGRIFAPWLAISYPTRTQLEMVSGDIVVQEGKPVRLAANVSGVVPDKAKLSLRTGKGKPRLRKIDVVDGECEYVIDTAFRGFEYRLTAGDARSRWHTVEVINSPNIERAELTLEYPEYIKRPAETIEALTITVPETTRIHWKLTLDRAVREATMSLAGQDPVPLEISPDGLTVKLTQVATESRAYGFSWIEREHGYSFTSPNYYMQVAPDRPPRVELTSPRRNVYSMLGRKLDLAFRGRDDHGVAESLVAYRLDKTEEEKVSFTPAKPIDGTEQIIDWDYRLVFTNLVVGQTITFAVELADAYPGEKGPHRSRSEARRIQFMSREDYLAQIEKQKKRLLSQLRTIYREEREVHEVVMRLDRNDPIFVQTCQLEAVRQDLMRERLKKLAGRMLELTDDLAANSITNVPAIETLAGLRSDLIRISKENISQAAAALRALASESGRKRNGGSAQEHAAHMVNGSARELGLLVLQLGFEDAAEVMAREMHAAAETQAALRLRTITAAAKADDIAAAQERLGKWLSRLFAASPKGKESTIEDALIEFTLTRIVKQLVNGGIDKRMQDAAASIRGKKPAEAAPLQSEVTADLLKAEFRLRVGAEREALAKAMKLFVTQAEEQKRLALSIKGLNEKDFKKQRSAMAQAQRDLQSKLQLLLMPAVPAPRTRLSDDTFPSAPPVNDLLVAADEAMTRAASHIAKGDRKAAEKEQQVVERSFASLADMTRKRIVAMTQAVRIERLAFASQSVDEKLGGYGERQLSLLEKTEDAAAEGTKSVYLSEQEEALADAVDELRMDAEDRVRDAGTPSEQSQAMPARINEAVRSMRRAVPLLKRNTPKEAVNYEKAAVSSLTNAQALLAEHGRNITTYAAMLSSARAALKPAPYVAEIEEEQRDMLALTRKLKPDDMPRYAIPQKNLVHAVDAILVALDPIGHVVESGTVMMFAKEDMDAAGEALAIKDIEEALDAQEYIVETLEKLRNSIEKVVPMYQYKLEIVESLHEIIPEGVLIREVQRRLREKTAEGDAAKLAGEQKELAERTRKYGQLVNEVTGLGYMENASRLTAEAEGLLKKGDKPGAEAKMAQAEGALAADAGKMLTLMKNFGAIFNAPELGKTVPKEVLLLRDVLSVATIQKRTYRESHSATPKDMPGLEPKLREFAKQCDPFIELAKTHKNPAVVEAPEPVPSANFQRHLIAAKSKLEDAAKGAKAAHRATMTSGQKDAAKHLRHFVVEYTLKFSIPPPPPPPQDPAPSDEFNESEDLMNLFMPGAVTGKRPPDGKLEWQVLGRRDRAALNENFARELPLEYRAILKDYYERLAR